MYRWSRHSITFDRRDNLASRKAHARKGMTEVATFTHDDIDRVVALGFNLA